MPSEKRCAHKRGLRWMDETNKGMPPNKGITSGVTGPPHSLKGKNGEPDVTLRDAQRVGGARCRQAHAPRLFFLFSLSD